MDLRISSAVGKTIENLGFGVLLLLVFGVEEEGEVEDKTSKNVLESHFSPTEATELIWITIWGLEDFMVMPPKTRLSAGHPQRSSVSGSRHRIFCLPGVLATSTARILLNSY